MDTETNKLSVRLRIGNFELMPHQPKKGNFEIVRWQGNTNYVIAYYRNHKEGYDLQTVSGRTFKEKAFWPFAQICYEVLMSIYRYSKYNTEEEEENLYA